MFSYLNISIVIITTSRYDPMTQVWPICLKGVTPPNHDRLLLRKAVAPKRTQRS